MSAGAYRVVQGESGPAPLDRVLATARADLEDARVPSLLRPALTESTVPTDILSHSPTAALWVE